MILEWEVIWMSFVPFRRDKADHYLLLRKMRYWLKTGGEESTVDDMQVIESSRLDAKLGSPNPLTNPKFRLNAC